MPIETYDGHCKVRFPFAKEVHEALLIGYGKEGIVKLELENGEEHELNVAQFVRYLMHGFIFDLRK